MICRNCLHQVDTKEQPFVCCNGLCTDVYHATCVGLNKEAVAAVSPPNRNSFWLCDDCFDEFLRWRERQGKPAAQTPQENKCVLHRDVEELKAKVDAIMSIVSNNATSPSDAVMRHSTPTLSPQNEIDSRVENSHSGTSFALDNSQPNTDQIDDSFALVLTNIDGSVTERDIQQMVSRCLGAPDGECENIRKLVPRWVDCTTLDYVSFKVSLNSRWKSAAMKSSTWPGNVKFREFKKRQAAWKPENL